MNARAESAERGAWAERHALEFLCARGLREIARNYRCRHGEIDLVLHDGAVVVFAEVRYRGPGAWVGGAESVDGRKQRRLLASAEHYLQHGAAGAGHREAACRFDVVSVGGTRERPVVEWIRDAFQA